ncbi:MAG: ferredoxin, partial [Zestosphaera sp.]
MIEFEEALKESVLEVAKMMALSARTAPKARGVDNIEVKILNTREELESLASKMEELSKDFGDFFLRDAQNVRNSIAVVLIGGKIVDLGLKNPKNWGLDAGLVCSLVNLGIAIG